MEVSREKQNSTEKSKESKIDDEYLTDSDQSFPDVECDLCCKEFSSVKLYEQHLNSKKHHQMLAKRKLKQKVGKLAALNGQTSNGDGGDAHFEGDSEELSCEICSKAFSGYIPYATHLKSNVHAKNLKKQNLRDQMKDLPEVIGDDEKGNESDEDGIFPKPFASCTLCKKVFHDPRAFQLHMKSAQHKKKILGQKTLETLKSQSTDDSKKSDGEDDEFFKKCETCDKSFSGPIPYKIHLRSYVHQKELKRVQVEDELKDSFTKDPENQKLICNDCKKPFTDAFAFKAHLNSNSHEKKKAKDTVLALASSHPEIVAVKSVQNLSSDEENGDGNYQTGSYFFVCKLCHLSFSGPESVRDHVQSKKHAQIKSEKEDRKRLQRKIKEKKSKDNSDHVKSIVNAGASDNSSLNTTVEPSTKPRKESDVNDEFELI